MNAKSSNSRILTTTVGSYPVPDWLVALPSEQAVIDATRVVIDTQEQAGIDLVCDGELYRFDVNHPETNGMIEYFVRPMAGVRREIGLAEWLTFKKSPDHKFRTRPPGVVESPIGPGSLDLPAACARAKKLATHPLKFTLTGPHMLAKMLLDTHYKDKAALAMAIADVLAAQVKYIDAEVIQVDEANLPGSPDEWGWAAGGDEPRARRDSDHAGRASVLRQLRRPDDSEGRMGPAHRLPEQAACRPHRHGERTSANRGACRVQGIAAGDRLRAGRCGHQTDRYRIR